jgi:hypothetical protein
MVSIGWRCRDMNPSRLHLPRRWKLLIATAALSAGALSIVPLSAQASAPGFPDIYCYHSSGDNSSRLLLTESNTANGDPRVAYTIITESWSNTTHQYEQGSASTKYALPPSDRSPSGICAWADSYYPIGSLA